MANLDTFQLDETTVVVRGNDASYALRTVLRTEYNGAWHKVERHWRIGVPAGMTADALLAKLRALSAPAPEAPMETMGQLAKALPGKRCVVYYDLETAGIEHPFRVPLSYGAVDAHNCFTLHQFVNQPIEVPEAATKINGITTARLRAPDTLSPRDALRRFVAIIEAFAGEDAVEVLLVAHNGDRFDAPIVRAQAEEHGVALPARWRFVDSLRVAKIALPNEPSRAMAKLRTMFGLSDAAAHTALGDVQDLRVICEHFRQRLGVATVEEMFDL